MSRRPYQKFHPTHRMARAEAVVPKSRDKHGNEQHGLYTLQSAVDRLGTRGLDGRSAVAQALKRWRADIVTSLGGEDVLSAQELTIIELASRTKLLLDSIDSYLLGLPSLVNKRRRALHPVVRERQALADALAKYLGQLGLQRREKKVADLATYLATKASEANAEGTDGDESVPTPSPVKEAEEESFQSR